MTAAVGIRDGDVEQCLLAAVVEFDINARAVVVVEIAWFNNNREGTNAFEPLSKAGDECVMTADSVGVCSARALAIEIVILIRSECCAVVTDIAV